MTSTATKTDAPESKGRAAIRLFLGSILPSEHGKPDLVLQSDRPGLTKIRITPKIPARADEGRPVSDRA